MRNEKEYFPDGTEIGEWFYETEIPKLSELGRPYSLKDFGIPADGTVQTERIQNVIDQAAENGGGVIVVSGGTWTSGALYFPQSVNLYVAKDGVLNGSEDISDFPLCQTRIEGQICTYFPDLINVSDVHGFVIAGEGTIDGSGECYWKNFWLRRAWNPECTNKDEQRPRLVFISNSKNVLIADLNLINAHFWTTHIYKCDHVKYLNCNIFSPAEPVKAPSTDAIDIDVCTDVLIKNCRMEVNDDAVVLKGGKGPWADVQEENGSNERIIIEDCIYGFCHGCLTCGSESVHNRNVIMRRIQVETGNNLLWLKMRPDTPQHYEYIMVEDITGKIHNFININPWTQFFDLKGRTDIPMSYAEHIVMKNCRCDCHNFFYVKEDKSQYLLNDFIFENLEIYAKKDDFTTDIVDNMVVRDINILVEAN
jgi:polygalacturonase